MKRNCTVLQNEWYIVKTWREGHTCKRWLWKDCRSKTTFMTSKFALHLVQGKIVDLPQIAMKWNKENILERSMPWAPAMADGPSISPFGTNPNKLWCREMEMMLHWGPRPELQQQPKSLRYLLLDQWRPKNRVLLHQSPGQARTSEYALIRGKSSHPSMCRNWEGHMQSQIKER